jgi:hypothetical protein
MPFPPLCPSSSPTLPSFPLFSSPLCSCVCCYILFLDCSRDSNCSGHGYCGSNAECECDTGFAGENCSKCDTNYFDFPACLCMKCKFSSFLQKLNYSYMQIAMPILATTMEHAIQMRNVTVIQDLIALPIVPHVWQIITVHHAYVCYLSPAPPRPGALTKRDIVFTGCDDLTCHYHGVCNSSAQCVCNLGFDDDSNCSSCLTDYHGPDCLCMLLSTPFLFILYLLR